MNPMCLNVALSHASQDSRLCIHTSGNLESQKKGTIHVFLGGAKVAYLYIYIPTKSCVQSNDILGMCTYKCHVYVHTYRILACLLQAYGPIQAAATHQENVFELSDDDDEASRAYFDDD